MKFKSSAHKIVIGDHIKFHEDLIFDTTPTLINFDKANLYIIYSLAITGLSIGERVLLVPWLMLYLAMQMMMVVGLVSSVIHQPASMGQALLVLVQLLLVVIWRQVQSQYQVMGLLHSTQVLVIVTHTEATRPYVLLVMSIDARIGVEVGLCSGG